MNTLSINISRAAPLDAEAALQSFAIVDRLIAVAGTLLPAIRQAATVFRVAALRVAQAQREAKMHIGAFGTGILFQANARKPSSFEDWEAQYLEFGYLAVEWWFRTGSALVRWMRSGASLVAAPKRQTAEA